MGMTNLQPAADAAQEDREQTQQIRVSIMPRLHRAMIIAMRAQGMMKERALSTLVGRERRHDRSGVPARAGSALPRPFLHIVQPRWPLGRAG
jgi:hypothetical protein